MCLPEIQQIPIKINFDFITQIYNKLGRKREICVPWLKSTNRDKFEIKKKVVWRIFLFSIVAHTPEESDVSA